MVRRITAKQMNKIDRQTHDVYGIPTIILMENAGSAVARAALEMVPRKAHPVASIFCGKGNNGGDGFVAARHLINKGWKSHVYLLGKVGQLTGDARTNFNILTKMGQKIREIISLKPLKKIGSSLTKVDLIIDAIFGIGLNGLVREPQKSIILLLNSTKKPILSVDVPSGLDATTGKIHGVCIQAARTVTFALPKHGFFKGQGPEFIGQLSTADIGIPKELL